MKIEEYLEKSHLSSRAKSRAKRHLIVDYSFKRKKRKETVCFYEDEVIEEMVANILWESVADGDRKVLFGRKRIYKKHIEELMDTAHLKKNELAERSPPMLWSLVHSFPNRNINDVIHDFVKSAIKALKERV